MLHPIYKEELRFITWVLTWPDIRFLLFTHAGDSIESWGFGGTGKKSTNKKFLDYGIPFGDGDVIGVVIDLDALTLAYTKNGQFLGTAFELPQRVRETGLFPHIYVKNFDFTVNFKGDKPWFKPPGSGITFIGDVKLHVGYQHLAKQLLT